MSGRPKLRKLNIRRKRVAKFRGMQAAGKAKVRMKCTPGVSFIVLLVVVSGGESDGGHSLGCAEENPLACSTWKMEGVEGAVEVDCRKKNSPERRCLRYIPPHGVFHH